MDRFCDVPAIASASLREILVLWEGLGYYSRARNIHRAARILVKDMNGELPRHPDALRKLPGIGRYTAGAIASIAFGADEPALDGNARRVLARVFNVEEPARSTSGEKLLWELAKNHLPTGRAGEFNQALMDLGALVCTPKNPDCSNCPLSVDCQARILAIQSERPVMPVKPTLPHYFVSAAVIKRGRKVLIAQRPLNGLLGGLWEFPGGKLQPGENFVECLQREIDEELGVKISVGESSGKYQHAYTHFRVTLRTFICSLVNGSRPQAIQVDAFRWVNPNELKDYPMGKIDRQISQDLLAQESVQC